MDGGLESGKKPLVLIVDDVPKNLQLLGNILKKENYEISLAVSGPQALSIAESVLPDLILMDIMMPEMSGIEVCKELKRSPKTREIPVIFLTAKADTEDIVIGFELGAVDYVTKPFKGAELLARIKTHLQLRQYQQELRVSYQKLQQAHQEIMTKNERLLEVQKQLELAARTDSLTGLANRRDMIEKVENERKRFVRNQRVFSLALGDIDNFKNFNDRFGHDCGDLVLVSIAETIRSLVREQDCVARWGGEEFLLLLPETDIEGGQVVSEKIRLAIAGSDYRYRDAILAVTMTFGVSVYDDAGMEIDDCLKRADNALYRGKADGKNCVVALRH